MSTAVSAPKIDENNVEGIRKVATKKIVAGAETKRAALVELGNKAIIRKDSVKESKDIKHVKNVRNAKPRVDTYWKKVAVPVKQVKPVAKIVPIQNPVLPKGEEKVPANPVRKEDKNARKKSLESGKQPNNQPFKASWSSKEGLQKAISDAKAICEKHGIIAAEKKPPVDGTKAVQRIAEVQSHSQKRLNGVDDIDAKDSNTLILVSEYVNDIYSYLYHLETEFPIMEDHLKNQIQVTPKMRSVLIDWINEVHHQFHLMPETYYLTVGIIDRYLQKVRTTSREHLQLVGVTALFISAKYEELYPPDINDFVYITDDTYNKHQILAMERQIMRQLNFQLSRPVAIHFLRRFSKAAKSTEYHHQLSKYFLELASIDYDLASCKPSLIAAASLYIALKIIDDLAGGDGNDLWNPTIQFYSRYTEETLKPIAKEIAKLVMNAPSGKLKAVYTKYQSSRFDSLSTKPELSGRVMEKLSSE